MARQWVCFGLFRFIFPLAFLAATVVRFNGFSLLYGCLLLVEPLIPRPTPGSMSGACGRFLIASTLLCSLTLLAQIVFQSYLLIVANDQEPYGTILKNCSQLETSLRQLGLQRLEPNDFGNILRVILPDIGTFFTSLFILIICKVLLSSNEPKRDRDTPSPSSRPIESRHTSVVKQRLMRHSTVLVNLAGHFLVILFLALSGITYPCVLSSVYFVLFICVSTWASCCQGLGRRYAALRIGTMIYSACHLVLIYVYQFQFFQTILPPNTLIARIVGLTGIVKTDCRKPWLLDFYPIDWPQLVSPGVILLLYFTLACETRRWFNRIREFDVNRGSKPPRRHRVSGNSERQVQQEGADQENVPCSDDELVSLVEGAADAHHRYNTMETVEAGSVAPSITSSGIQSEAGERNSQGSLLQKRGPLESIAIFVMRQSYVGTLIIMMAWSITYHSWLTFVFLLWACIIWLIPQKRDVCLRCSPLIVLYAVCLLVICYVYGFNLTDAELPVQSENGYKFREIGLIKYDHQCIQLAVQVLFTVMFWVTLRQAVQEWMQRRQSAMGQGLALEVVGAPPPENEDPFRVQHRMPSNAKDGLVGHDSDAIKSVGRWMWHMFCKYWIFVCTGMFLLIALQEAVIYRIIYMVLFLYFVITFQICYRWWRLSISVFWWVVIIYSMIVLCVLYTYQFDEIPWGWVNRTSISKEVLSDIGLEKFDTGTLFVKLLTPTSFLIVIIIQLHYFQRPFLTLSDINRFRSSREETTELNVEDEDEANRIHSNVSAQSDDPIAGPSHDEVTQETDLETSTQVTSISPRKQRRRGWRDRFARAFSHAWNTMYNMLDAISALLWRFMEVHIVKIVMLTVIIVSMSEVCALNVLFVVFVVVGVVSPSLFALMSHLCQCWSAVVILCKMTYQLNVISSEDVLTNCTHVSNAPFSNATHDQLPYPFNGTIDNANYIGLEKAPNLAEYLRNYIFVVVIIGLEAVVKVHQMQYWNHIDHSKPKHGIVFPETKRADADTGLLPCAKFFMNYTFYKFGLQICFIMTMITMVVRLDVYSVLYGIMLGVLLLLNRRTSYVVWPVYMVVLMVLLVLQYLSCLGVPPGLCWVYPWDNISNFTRNLKIYLYLPNYLDPPNPYKLIADFFQLLFVCLQWWVFRLENSPSQAEAYGGGSNKDIVRDVEENKPNPVEDFLSYKDSYVDYLKAGLFQYSFWVTLVIVFIAGTARISLFCLGYLVGCFFFFWFGQDLLLKPLPNLLRLWGILLGYNYFVILAKACLQMVGCVYLNDLIGGSYCWVVQLFSIVCLRSGNYIPTSSGSTCRLDEDEAGLTWDAICFVFLLIMLRVFKSWYFQHVVMELYVENKLASRGAELINTNLIKRVAEMKSRERDTLASIKRKMERIRLRQARLQSKAIKESEDHYIVIRSGDYYMFEDDSDEDEASSVDVQERDDQRDEEEDAGKVGPLQILDAAFKGGTKEALEVAEGRRISQRSESEEDAECSSSRARVSRLSGPTTPPGTEPDIIEEMPEGELPSDEDEDEEEEEETKAESACNKLVSWIKLGWAIFCGLLDYLIVVLHNISRENRSVSRILDREMEEEKRRLRAQEQNTQANADEDDLQSSPHPSLTRKATDISIHLEQQERDISMLRQEQDIDAMKDAEKEFQRGMPRLLQLVHALIEVLLSRSDLLCYFAMILNVLVNASILALPYPFCVFLWALLSVPRPTKTYWVTIITYTEAIVVVKYLFQFGFFPWNDGLPQDGPFWPPRIIGIEKKSSYAVFDLILLFCLFVHRSVMKRYGLWKDAGDIEEDFAAAEQKVQSRPNSSSTSPMDVPSITFTDADVEGAAANAAAIAAANAAAIVAANASDTSMEVTGSDDSSPKHKKHKKGLLRACVSPFLEFYQQMTNPKYNAVTDVYATIFLCDFVTFVIVVFGYWAFGPAEAGGGTETVASVIQENKVPPLFLAMLLVQFLLIIVDRALYLRKQVFGKFLFQIFLVILVHVWMFFILPFVTNRKFQDNLPAQLWYFTKCIYFGFSAYQIRSGYPTRILGNFLTKKFNYINLFLFQGFLLIPFLLELRALMDWMWTDTTLALTSWLQMEDIYANIFVLKCWRRAEDTYPTPRGVKRRALVKYGVGGLLLFLLIFIIWFPLLLFSLSSTIFQPNPPIDCTVEMKLGSYQPIFTMSAQQSNLREFTPQKYAELKTTFSGDPTATSFLSGYQANDIYEARIYGISTATWDISPPSEQALTSSLLKDPTVNLYVTISFKREPSDSYSSGAVSNQFTKILHSDSDPDMKIRRNLAHMLNGTYESTDPIEIPHVYPPYMVVKASSKPEPADPLLGQNASKWANSTFRLRNQPPAIQWWELESKKIEDNKVVVSENLTILTFNERVAPGAFSFFTSYGVMGLYISVVIVIGQFVRIFFSGTSNKIMFEQLPSVERLYKLCLDIYMVRETSEFKLEEELFSKLIFVYRSPETMIKWTKIKGE